MSPRAAIFFCLQFFLCLWFDITWKRGKGKDIAGYQKFIWMGYQSTVECAKLISGIPDITRMPYILQMPFQILNTQWKICEKFHSVFCFPKQTICWNFLHKASGIAFKCRSRYQHFSFLSSLARLLQNQRKIYFCVLSKPRLWLG